MTVTELQHKEVAREVYAVVLDHLKDSRGIHAESAVAALSAICGESILRSCNVDLSKFPQGGIILVDEVNDSTPRILAYLEQVLGELGIKAEIWTGKIPPDHQPVRDPLKLAQELRPKIATVFANHKLDDAKAAKAACLALAIMIRDVRDVLPTDVSIIIASNYIARISKSVPIP